MRAFPAVLRARPDVKIIMVGGDGVSYGARLGKLTWREHMLAELGTSLDTSRVFFPGKLDYENYLRLLQRSDAHVYFHLSVRPVLVAARGALLRVCGDRQ